MKILVIDDEQPTLTMFELLLSTLGHEVLLANSGERGLEVFAEHHPPLVLTDIKMPGMDGIEVLGRLKEEEPSVEVVVITGHGDMDVAIQALNLDATDFINKPLRLEVLQKALERVEERIKLSTEKFVTLSTRFTSDTMVITVRGTLGTADESEIKHAFKGAGKAQRIVLDFAENTSINGAAIALLTDAIRSFYNDGGKVVISGLSENFRNVFEIMGVTRFATFVDNIQELEM
ncbi:response regulator [Halodesulfovibrio sp. MK-HDV]|jgi:CheY-like chemotaxis protein/anti-anti-sigma regulatory factor|uniref:response regulator n=1 Tax=unclassified Halodesulfovibrio TaxID=2644657 RepID=UPI00136F09A2|nr:response regulator [Halodesulfovibrio sp. MK-HDV]KAF1075345.1 Regulatory protein AtoC [Halodesulfovibrio sp. MK-HDV]